MQKKQNKTMLSPKRTKYRKSFKLKPKGNNVFNDLHFGVYGLKALESGRITNKQIEAACILTIDARVCCNHANAGLGSEWLKPFCDAQISWATAIDSTPRSPAESIGAPDKFAGLTAAAASPLVVAAASASSFAQAPSRHFFSQSG